MKLEPIKYEHRELLKQKFKEAKKLYSSYLKDINFNDIGLYWWVKDSKRGFRGKCWNGKKYNSISIRYKNLNNKKIGNRWHKHWIVLASYLVDDTNQFIQVYLHELGHIIAQPGAHHNNDFKLIEKHLKSNVN